MPEKTLKQIDAEVDELLAEIEARHVYERTHKPKLVKDLADFSKSIPEQTRVMARNRYLDYVKKEGIEHGNYIKVENLNNLVDIKAYPIEKLLEHYGMKLGRISSQRLSCGCPLHNEKNASFVVYLNTNSWYCFGCNKGGSVIDFVMQMEKCDFTNAIKIIKRL